MLYTNHSDIRCQQRGISQKQIDLILSLGEKRRRPGGAWEYRLLKKDKNKYICELKKEIHLLEKCIGKAVLIASDMETVVTTYHLTKG